MACKTVVLAPILHFIRCGCWRTIGSGGQAKSSWNCEIWTGALHSARLPGYVWV